MFRTLDYMLRKFRARKHGHSHENPSEVFGLKYEQFKALLDSNSELLKIIAELEDKLQGSEIFGMSYIRSRSARAIFHALKMVESFHALSGRKSPVLLEILENINSQIGKELGRRTQAEASVDLVLPYTRVTTDVLEWTGVKNANLGEVRNRVKLPVPEGFAVTTRAFDMFMGENDLFDQIAMQKMNLESNDPASLHSVSEEIQRLILMASIPEVLQKAILSACDDIAHVTDAGSAPAHLRVSMRSSALGEDGELTFAGQYLSLLNVTHEQVLNSYKYVVASLFTPRAISYRLLNGVPDEQAAMSVACIHMVDSIAGGVIYSLHPFEPGDDSIIISAVWGLGPYAVDGTITPDRYTVVRTAEGNILEKSISSKPVKLVCNPEGGLREVAVPESCRDKACLSDVQISTLAAYALRLEEHFGSPQDIEWALDSDGRLLVLQSRMLASPAGDPGQKAGAVAPLDYPVLLDTGAAASPGIGYGRAFRVRTDQDLLDFPEGAVLVAARPSPKYMVVMSKATAIVTDFGSVTGHMASLAREFSVPAVVDTRKATAVIPDGMEITVDAASTRVYQGIIADLVLPREGKKSRLIGTPVHDTLKRVAALITPLRLVDPKSPEFAPQNCKSIHDITRFVHELSYSEMFRISDLLSEEEGLAVKLSAPVPLDLYVIDLGGGISTPAPGATEVTADSILSVPFRALLNGMLHKDLALRHARPIELGGFFSVMSQQMFQPAHQAAERFGSRSYAIVSDRYLNFSSRVGYHYSVLDSYCGKTLSNNYISFSFSGGAADDIRRNRRARAISLILDAMGMSVEVTGDRVAARLTKLEAALLTEKLDQIGRLLQFSRQMDMLMGDEATVAAISKAFLEGNYHLR